VPDELVDRYGNRYGLSTGGWVKQGSLFDKPAHPSSLRGSDGPFGTGSLAETADGEPLYVPVSDSDTVPSADYSSAGGGGGGGGRGDNPLGDVLEGIFPLVFIVAVFAVPVASFQGGQILARDWGVPREYVDYVGVVTLSLGVAAAIAVVLLIRYGLARLNGE
jgi:hypothetical protein